MKFNLVNTEKGFMPATDADKEKVHKIGIGEVVSCRSLDKRNYEMHKKFFALIHIAFDNLPEKYDGHFKTEDQLRKELTKRAGYYDEYVDLKGNTQYVPKSIAFDKMGQEEFEQLYNAVLDVILKWILPDLDVSILEHEIMNFI